MKPEVGKYYVCRRMCGFGVFVWDHVSEHGSLGHGVAHFGSYEQAVREMYRLNGWKQPDKIYKRY